jgi:hypothetical protein
VKDLMGLPTGGGDDGTPALDTTPPSDFDGGDGVENGIDLDEGLAALLGGEEGGKDA